MMLKIQYIVSSLVLMSFCMVPATALAAMFTLSPATISVNQGQTLSIAVGVDSSAPAYTISFKALFTPGVLSFSAWNFEDAWLPLRQAGYETTDNGRGALVRTAGYPGGFAGAARLGILSFTAVRPGRASIALDPDSFIYNERGENVYAGGAEAIVNVLPPGMPVPPSIPEGASPPGGQTPPTLFDISAGTANQPSSTARKPGRYVPIIVVVSALAGVGAVVAWERFRRSRMLKQQKRTDHE